MANVKFSVNAGLHNDYGIFNLSEAAVSKIKLDFVVNAESFVDNDNSEYMHGSTSAYKEFEGILPLCRNEADWGLYGPTFAQILRHYMLNRINAYQPEAEIYDKQDSEYQYSNYKNQFLLDFYGADDDNNYAYNLQGRDNTGKPFKNLKHDLNSDWRDAYANYKYLNYREEVRTFSDKIIKTVSLAEAQSGTYLTVQAIHFSKYYPLYSITSGIEKTLLPLIYTVDDLNKFNIGLTNSDDNTKVGIPVMKSLVALDFHRYEDCGWFSCDRCETINLYIGGWADYKRYVGPSWISGRDDETHSGHGWSAFRNGAITGWSWIDSIDASAVAPGFSAFSFMGTNAAGYYINEIGDAALPTEYTKTFTALSNYGHVLLPYYSWSWTGYNVRQTITLSLIYKQDSASNFHIFNTWFPVKGDGGGATLEIYYTTEGAKIYPKYVGQILVSILANIYVYKESQNNSINYISDIIYLSDNGTLYTKDMPFRMYIDSQYNDNNDCLLVRKQPFGDYVNKLKEFINHEDEKWEQNISDNNVTVKFREMIKNQPIQFRLDYISPDLSYIGLQSYVLLKKLDGTTKRVLSDIVKSDKMYLVNSNDRISYLNEEFTIKWIDTITVDNSTNTLTTKEYEDLPEYNNREIYRVFSYRNGAFDMETTSISGTTPSYWVHSDQDLSNNMYNFVASDILFPPARLA